MCWEVAGCRESSSVVRHDAHVCLGREIARVNENVKCETEEVLQIEETRVCGGVFGRPHAACCALRCAMRVYGMRELGRGSAARVRVVMSESGSEF